MAKGRHFALIATGTALLFGAAQVSARAKDSLVLVPTSGAELAFVAPASDTVVDPVEEAIKNLSRAISQAAAVQQQQTQAKCRAAQTQGATREQRFAWAANCQYARR